MEKFIVRDANGSSIANPRLRYGLPDGSHDSLTEDQALETVGSIAASNVSFPLKIVHVDTDGTETVLMTLIQGDYNPQDMRNYMAQAEAADAVRADVQKLVATVEHPAVNLGA
jgi:hypothetical protein